MSFINNKKDNIISLKMTEIGRKKIANGTLNYSSWAVGDSEINYSREEYQSLNNLNVPAKILLPADSQPNLKYFITSDSSFETVKTPIVNGDINLMKLTANSEISERGITTNKSFVSSNIKLQTKIKIANISGRNIVLDSVSDISIGDILFMEVLTSVSEGLDSGLNISPISHTSFKIVNVNSDTNTITLNRIPPKPLGVTFSSGVIYDGREVVNVPSWNTDENVVWNGVSLNYDLNQRTISNTKPWSFNIITLEQLAGYADFKTTIGYKYFGFAENYLGYNDSNRNFSEELNNEGCSEKLINGFVDDFQKTIGLIHFENGHHSNLYGDSFYIANGKKFKLNLPSVLHYTTNEGEGGLTAESGTELKTIPYSEIEYYDLLIQGRNLYEKIIIGKVFHQFKVAVIEDEEIIMALSIGSGRNYTLPPLTGKLLTDSNGLLDSGKQIFVTYTFRDKSGTNNFFSNSIHCNKYLTISNTTTTSKNVELKFENVLDFVHMVNPNVNTEIGYTSDNFEIIYQIRNIGDRPLAENWVSVDFSSGVKFRSTPLNKDVLNPIALTSNSFILTPSLITTEYSSIESGLDVTKEGNLIGDETVLVGSVNTSISSVIYKSLIQIRLNTNLHKYSTNPTRIDLSQEPIVSEIGIYDSDEDLVMIAKLSNPIKLSTKSSILLELSMDF